MHRLLSVDVMIFCNYYLFYAGLMIVPFSSRVFICTDMFIKIIYTQRKFR
jgi:hypothetical protein